MKHRQEGWAFLEQKNFDKARVEFDNALQIDPRDRDAHYGAGQVAERVENFGLAAAHYRAAIDVSPQELKSRVALARIYLLSGAREQAQPLIDESLKLNANEPEALTLAGAIAFQQGDTAAAERSARAALKADPANVIAVTFMAGLLTTTEKPDEAIAEVKRVLQQKPQEAGLRAVLAQLYERRQDLAGAVEQWRAIIALDPTSAVSRNALAQFYLKHDDPAAAEKVLRDAVAERPQNAAMTVGLADFLRARGKLDDALAVVSGAADAQPKDFDLVLAKADLLERLQRNAEAQTAYRAIVAASEASDRAVLAAQNRLARMAFAAGDLAATKKAIDEILAKNKADGDALYLRALVALSEKRAEDAIADLRSALRDRPSDLPMLRSLSLAYQVTGDVALAKETLQRIAAVAPKDAGSRLMLADLSLQSGQANDAVALTGEAMSLLPKNPDVAVRNLVALASAKEWGKLLAAAEALGESAPEDARAPYFEALAELALGKADAAETALLKSLKQKPGAGESLTQLTQLYITRKKPAAAEALLAGVLRQFPGHLVATKLLGDVRLAQNNPADAIKQFSAAIAAQPQWWLPYRGWAMAASVQRDHDGMKRALADGYRATSESALAMDLALLEIQEGRHDEAVTLYREVLARDKANSTAANNLAMLLAQHRHDQKSLDEALALARAFGSSSDANFLDTLGYIHLMRAEHQDAANVLQRALTLRPNDPQLLSHYAAALNGVGRVDDARKTLRKALADADSFEGKEDAQALLKSLGG